MGVPSALLAKVEIVTVYIVPGRSSAANVKLNVLFEGKNDGVPAGGLMENEPFTDEESIGMSNETIMVGLVDALFPSGACSTILGTPCGMIAVVKFHE
jgi:hypothetical protein